jgi:hypothetical protein
MLEDHLSRFEERLQRLVEGGFARLFAGHLQVRDVANSLAHAMEDNLINGPSGLRLAPDIYSVRLNPRDHAVVIQSGDDLASELAVELIELARSAGFKLSYTPEVILIADQSVGLHAIAVSAQHKKSRSETTQALPLSELHESLDPAGPLAVLVMDNRQVPLDRPITNLGRHRDNDIIINDPRVSRHHAQIRLRFGRFVLFDLGSSGGTTVNGRLVQEHNLMSGDIIGLSGCTLIYLEEDAENRSDDTTPTDTQTFHPL